MSVDHIRSYLPHRAPFLYVDRILEIIIPPDPSGASPQIPLKEGRVGTKVVAIKSVSYNEPFMQGHFPNFSVMPGVIIIEAMAQVAAFCPYPALCDKISLPEWQTSFGCLLVGVDGVRFRRPVVPGDQLRIEVEVTKIRGSIWIYQCRALVDGRRVAEAELMAEIRINPTPGKDR